MAYKSLTDDEQEALSVIAKAVLQNPDIIDEIISGTTDDIPTDPTVLALRLVQTSVQQPSNFDSSLSFAGAALVGGAALLKGAASKVAGLFSDKDKSEDSQGFLKGVFSSVGSKLSTWKDNRDLKKDLKDSGDPNWKQTFKDLKKGTAGGGGADMSTLDPTGKGEKTTLADYRSASGSTTAPNADPATVIPEGLTVEQIEAGLKQLEAQSKSLKTWKILGVGFGIAFVLALVWALTSTMGSPKKSSK